MARKSIVIISSLKNMTYFFSKDHCQNHGMGEDFVPVTHYYPTFVNPRPSLPEGVIRDYQDIVSVFYSDMKEILNPNPDMQP